MSDTAQLAVLLSIAFVGVLVAIDAALRPYWFLLMYAVANIADIGFVTSTRGVGPTSITLSDLLLCGAVLTLLVRDEPRQWRWPSMAMPLVAFMGVGAAQIIRGAALTDLSSALAEGRFVLFPLAWFCAYAMARHVDDPRRVLGLLVSVVVAVALVGSAMYLTTSVVNLEFNHVPGRVAGYAVLAAAVLISGVLPAARRFRPLALAVLAMFLFVSGSKQAIVLLPLLYLVVRRTTTHALTRTASTLAVVGLVALTLWFAIGTDTNRPAETLRGYQETISDPFDDGGVSWRRSYWNALLDETPSTDWVTGTGIYPYFTDLELSGFDGDVADTPHNSLLVMTLLGGVVLTVLYVLAIAGGVRSVRSSAGTPHLVDLYIFVLVVGNVFLLFNAEHRAAGVWPFMWLLLGILHGMIDRERAPEATRPTPAVHDAVA